MIQTDKRYEKINNRDLLCGTSPAKSTEPASPAKSTMKVIPINWGKLYKPVNLQ